MEHTTYVDENGVERLDRRLTPRDQQDERVAHLFDGFDNLIANYSDGYVQGYLMAMREEFARLVRDRCL